MRTLWSFIVVALLGLGGYGLAQDQQTAPEPLRSQVSFVVGFKSPTVMAAHIELPLALPVRAMVINYETGATVANLYQDIRRVVDIEFDTSVFGEGKFLFMFEAKDAVGGAVFFQVKRAQGQPLKTNVELDESETGSGGDTLPVSGWLDTGRTPDGGPALGPSPIPMAAAP